jgi:hypothetical protein
LPDREPADQLYRRLLEIHNQAFEAERFELGYHVLAAALHAAEELNDNDLLTEVGRLAEERQKKIDAITPQHRLSSSSAHRRGNPSQYNSLVTIAAAAKGRINADHALGRSQRARGR